MSADWQVGDLALCVNASPDWVYAEPAISAYARLEQGKVYRVVRLGENHLGKTGLDIGVPNRDLFEGYADIWPPQCFRKIRPDEHEPCEAEFVTLLKRSEQPAKVLAHG